MPSKRGDRARIIEGFFADGVETDGVMVFKCLIEECGANVACKEKRGAPGRANHIVQHHATTYATIPPARITMKIKSKPNPGTPISSQSLTQRSSTEATDDKKVDKKRRLEEDGAVVELFARTLLPFSLADDAYFSKSGVHRKNIADKMATRLGELKNTFAASDVGGLYSVTIDSGTNSGTKTMNICVVHRGVCRTVAACRLETHTAENILEAIQKAILFLDGKMMPTSFVSDNAANVRAACRDIASKMRALNSSCICHSINIVVRRIAYTWKCVDDARSLVDRLREDVRNIPPEIDSRWIACFHGIEHVIKNKQALFYNESLSKADVDVLEQAKAALAPMYFASRSCERDGASIFDSIKAMAAAFVTASKDNIFPEIFNRNMYFPAIVAACALNPLFQLESAIKPYQLMIEQCVRDCLYQMDPDFNERHVDTQLRILLEGGVQRIYRMKEPKDRQSTVDLWANGETPALHRLAAYLAQIPASSASVERCFSAHARLHNTFRCNLSEDSVAAQLGLHSFLKKNGDIGGNDAPTVASAAECELVIQWCLAAWSIERSETMLKDDLQVVIWFTGNNRMQQYKAKLISQEGRLWTVRWHAEPKSAQKFNPLVDPWVTVAENL